MSKVQLGPQALVYPMPALLIGANVNGKPNFMLAAYGGIANGTPPMISVAVRHQRYTNKGIMQNKTFSVNIPSVDLVKESDYCGITSGAKVDKVKVCGFKVFYGKLEGAPMIEQCPLNLECTLAHVLDLGTHAFIIGKVEETYVSDDCITDGNADPAKIKPFSIITDKPSHYVALGESVGTAFTIGKEFEGKM